MSTETPGTNESLERNMAFATGLGSESPTEVSSAIYICSELNGLPKLEDDFEFKRGYGVSSESIQLNLAFLYSELKEGTYYEIEGAREKGELLSEYEDDLIDVALYLYRENNPDRPMTNGWRKAINRLEEKESKLEAQIQEIKQQLN